MAEILVSCPSCGVQLSATDEYIGHKAQCPECGMRFIISCNADYSESSNSGKENTDDALMNGDAAETEFQANIANCKPIATIALMAASILATLFVFCKTGDIEPDAQSCVAYGANFKPLTLGGQWWRMVVSSFLHFDLKHLVMNMLCLYSIGCLFEKLVGHLKIIELYFFTAITGSLASCIFHPNEVCAGASGAVFGLLGAEVAYVMILRGQLGLTSENLGGYMKSGLVFVAVNLAYSLMPGVDMAAHIGGLLGGLAIGAVIASAVKEGSESGLTANRVISGIVIIVALGLTVSIFFGRNAGRLSISRLTAQISQMITENLNKNGDTDGSFEVTNLFLTHGTGKRYHGTAEIVFKCGGKTYPLSSRIEVVHDALETSYELNKEEFDEGLEELQRALQNDFIDELKGEVSRMLTENISKGLKKDGYRNVSVTVKSLSLTHDGGNRYLGNVEVDSEFDGKKCPLNSRIVVVRDTMGGVSYELNENDFSNWQKKAFRLDVDELKSEVSRMLSQNISKGLKKDGYRNVSVTVDHLSLTHDEGEIYYGRVEMTCRYDGETETIKSRIEVTYDGETIAYELKTDE